MGKLAVACVSEGLDANGKTGGGVRLNCKSTGVLTRFDRKGGQVTQVVILSTSLITDNNIAPLRLLW